MGLLDKIKDNNSQSEGKEILMGICNFLVEAINPTMDQLTAMGYSPKQEPVYTGEKDGQSTLRLDIYLKNPVAEYKTANGMVKKEFKTKMAFFLEGTEIKSKSSGKPQFINAYGQTSYADNVDSLPSWFDKEGVRVAHVGEEQLITFLYKWLGLTQKFKDKAGDVCMLDTPWAKLISGDIKELQQYAKAAANNGVKYLTGAKEAEKDGKTVYYQDIYTKYPMKPGQFSFTGLTEMLNDEYGQWKSIYPQDYQLQVFTPGAVVPDMEKAFAVPSSNGVAATTNDLPF